MVEWVPKEQAFVAEIPAAAVTRGHEIFFVVDETDGLFDWLPVTDVYRTVDGRTRIQSATGAVLCRRHDDAVRVRFGQHEG